MARPQKFTPESMMKKAKEYFNQCDKITLAVSEKTGMVTLKPKTLTGLCLYL
mgnify:CR=1 FL=1